MLVVALVLVGRDAQFGNCELVWVHCCLEVGFKICKRVSVRAPVLLLEHVEQGVIESSVHLVPNLHFVILMGDHDPNALIGWLCE